MTVSGITLNISTIGGDGKGGCFILSSDANSSVDGQNGIKENRRRLFLKHKSICQKYDTEFLASPFNQFIAVSIESFDKFTMPINGTWLEIFIR